MAIDSARRRAILAALALRHGTTVSIDSLCEALWGEDLPPNARGNLQSHVSRLRSSLGTDAVVLDHGGYRLVLDDPATDVDAVERLAARAAALRSEAPREAGRLLSEALAHWQGAALVEFADRPAFLADAARLDELERKLTDDLHEVLLDAGDAGDVLPAIQQTAIAEPLRERAQLLLVRALHTVGRSAEALRAAASYRRRLVDETGMSPSGALDALEQQVLTGEAPPTAATAAAPAMAPPPSTAASTAPPRLASRTGAVLPRHGRFFGRDGDLDALRRAMQDARFVTVAGTGGVGKTRLVAEAVVSGAFGSQPVVVVELAATRPGDVAQTVAAAFGLRTDMGEPIDVLVEYLSVESALLMLDNCEHVAADVHEVVQRVLSEAPDVRLLVTSRSRIGIPGERVVPIGPLPLDGPGGAAVQLFLDRARHADASFESTADIAVVEQICRRLDGVPLALELAAGRAAVLGADALLSRLDDALNVLETPSVGADHRHATLRAVVEWSYQLLDDDTRRVLDALSVFEGGFDIDAAERVARASARTSIASALARLVDSSLVVMDRESRPPRYRLLESVRAFAAASLENSRRERSIGDAHAAWVVETMKLAATRSAGPDERAAFGSILAERSNISRACAHLLRQQDAERIASIARSIATVCVYRPVGDWLRWVRVAAGETRSHAVTRAAAARAAYLQGDLAAIDALARPIVDGGATEAGGAGAAARHIAAHALGVGALYIGDHLDAERWWRRTLDDPDASTPARLDALGGVALARCYSGDDAGAHRCLAEHRTLAEAIDSDTYRAFGDYVAGELLLRAGRVDDAVETLRRAAATADAGVAEFVRGLALTALVSAQVRTERTDVASTNLVALLELWRRSATWPQLWTTLRLCAEALSTAGRMHDAALLFAAADCDSSAPTVTGPDRARIDELRESHRAALGDDQLELVALRARATPRAQIVAFAERCLRGA